ncbi:hypothetical protein ACP4OV_003780 [Aristida adscensionis]
MARPHVKHLRVRPSPPRCTKASSPARRAGVRRAARLGRSSVVALACSATTELERKEAAWRGVQGMVLWRCEAVRRRRHGATGGRRCRGAARRCSAACRQRRQGTVRRHGTARRDVQVTAPWLSEAAQCAGDGSRADAAALPRSSSATARCHPWSVGSYLASGLACGGSAQQLLNEMPKGKEGKMRHKIDMGLTCGTV